MVKVSVDVTHPELLALEDVTVCWILCDRHKRKINATEEQLFKFTQTCKTCVKLNKKSRSKALRLWSKLMTGYYETRKKRKHN